MKWYCLNTGFNTGRFNMDYDLLLCRNCGDDEAYFRLYRWEPYCISLGANQNSDAVDQFKIREDKIDVVKRPTGGRAILHSEEQTYSVILPVKNISSPKSLYFEINKALTEGLIYYDNRLASVELKSEQADLRRFYKEPVSEICFAVSARSEIQFENKKLAGSAQRRIRNSVLQHGSILCGKFHRKITQYLKFAVNQNDAENHLTGKTIELEEILGQKTDYPKLEESLIKGFEKHFNIKFENINYEILSTN